MAGYAFPYFRLRNFIRWNPSNSQVSDFLKISERERDGITILDLDGRVILGPEDLELRERLLSLLAAGKNNLILNFKDVSDIDTTGIGTLVHCAQKFDQARGRIVFLNLAPQHAQIPEILKLNTLLASYNDETEAVNSFYPERAVPHYDILEFVEKLEEEKQHSR